MGPRACGKTTVGKTLQELLPSWRFVDIDYEYRVRYKPVFTRINASQDSAFYEGCRGVMLDSFKHERIIIALNGGALSNNVSPRIAAANLASCKKRGKLVLILPSRFDFRNRSVLCRREQEREYRLDPEQVCKNYKSRVKFLRSYAHFIVTGTNPVTVAKKIITHFALE